MEIIISIREFRRGAKAFHDKMRREKLPFMLVAHGFKKDEHFLVVDPKDYMERVGGETAKKISAMIDKANKKVSDRIKHTRVNDNRKET